MEDSALRLLHFRDKHPYIIKPQHKSAAMLHLLISAASEQNKNKAPEHTWEDGIQTSGAAVYSLFTSTGTGGEFGLE